MAKIAFLVLKKSYKNAKRGRKEVNSFDGQSNIGSYMIKDVLERHGFSIYFCDVHTAKNYDIVLVSLASSFDVYNFLENVMTISHWQQGNRPFLAIVGGFGCQNITPLRNFIDIAFFGRVEDIIAEDLTEIIKEGGIQRDYVMTLNKGISPVKLHQTSSCYPYELATRPKPYKEFEIGCPRKCLFCHYSFSRKFIGDSFRGNVGYNSKELIFNDILDYHKQNPEYKGRTKTALDGYSERLRMAFNKRYSDDMIVETIQRLSELKTIWLQIYMIGSYPTETQEDRESFLHTIKQIHPKNKTILTIHTFPFRPSPLTPSQYLSANIETDWARMNKIWCITPGFLYRANNFDVNWNAWQDSTFTHLLSLIAERATEESDQLIKTIIFSKTLKEVKTYKKVLLLKNKYDLTQYVREYHTTEQLPTWYLESYIPNTQIQKIAVILKQRLGIPEA